MTVNVEAVNYTQKNARNFLRVCRAVAVGTPQLDRRTAAERFGYDEAARILKASTAATPLSELPEFAAAANAWLRSLKNSAFDALTRFMVQVPRRSQVSVMTATAGEETEGRAKALRRLGINPGSFTEKKAVAFYITTKEVANAPDFDLGAMDVELREAVALATDTPFLTILKSGVSGIASTGNFDVDMRALFASVPRGALSRPVFIGASNVRDDLSLTPDVQSRSGRLPVAGGEATALDIPFVTSDALNAGELILADASRIAFWQDPMDVTAAEHASIEMDNDPSQASTSPPAPSTMVNLWQTNSVGFMTERRFAAQKLTSNCVGMLTGIGQGSPAVVW
jgi:hypothetical protein